jgi:hypothetical protein
MHLRDFTPTKEQITLHGLGFIQVKLPANRRLHVWHPDLPRRACYEWSAIHNHRFSFRSTVIVGTRVNRRYDVITAPFEEPFGPKSHLRISHDGPRCEKGGRLSYVAGQARAEPLPIEHYAAGQSYEMPMLQYHETPNSGVVVTLMEKLSEGTVHASTLIDALAPVEFDQDFDRFQMPPDRLWQFVVDSLRGAA